MPKRDTDSDSDSDSDSDIEKENKGWSTGKKVALGVGVGVAALVGGYELIHHIGDYNDEDPPDTHDTHDTHDTPSDNDRGFDNPHDYDENTNTIIVTGRAACRNTGRVIGLIDAHRESIENEYEHILILNIDSPGHRESWADEGFMDDLDSDIHDDNDHILPGIIKKKTDDHDWISYPGQDYGDALLDWMTS